MTRESCNVERPICEWVVAAGGEQIKLNPSWYAGIPDQLILMPQAWMCFCETKTPEGALSPIQKSVHKLLRSLGFRVYVPTSLEAFIRSAASDGCIEAHAALVWRERATHEDGAR